MPHLQMPSHWGNRFQYTNLTLGVGLGGRHRHSDHNCSISETGFFSYEIIFDLPFCPLHSDMPFEIFNVFHKAT